MFDDKYGLTKAVLDGRKTMTRMVVNPGILPQITEMRILPNGLCQYKDPYIGKWYDSGKRSQPKYQVYEYVAVAQSYKGTGNYPEGYIIDEFHPNIEFEAGWNNKMFVRANLMPHQIRITSVRVERLQYISDGDCMREGIYEGDSGVTVWVSGCEYDYPCFQYDDNDRFASPREAFAALIDKMFGKGTWQSNPWVFVYEFELIK